MSLSVLNSIIPDVFSRRCVFVEGVCEKAAGDNLTHTQVTETEHTCFCRLTESELRVKLGEGLELEDKFEFRAEANLLSR